ncbi:hypothetical protein [Bradyrhizobium sp. SZCCHNRI1058]|uniref:hypothetical protein n=1 Tax=Bradyrhizobium sp. SZCCHNRI1058 TaxID=3057279 RepID=UPI002916E3E1|nr:hypothetical protein [Bradyrhizobium sp. SZCCHNRI1058]
MGDLAHLLGHAGIAEKRGDGASGHHETHQRRHRHRDGENNQQRLDEAVPAPEFQPMMQADAAVDPDQQQQRGLNPGRLGPQQRQRIEVAILNAEQRMSHVGLDDMRQQQQRDRKSGGDLNKLPRGQPPRAALNRLGERQHDMREQCRRQHDHSRPRSGDDQSPFLHLVHRLEAEQTHRMVEKMRRGERKQDEAGHEPDVLGRYGRHELTVIQASCEI